MLRDNPVKARRKQLNFSINQLEQQSGISRQVIIRAEQGCYATIPYRLHSYLVARLGDSLPNLNDDYRAWVAEKRRDSFGKLSSELPTFVAHRHPFIHWRQEAELTRAGTCVLFCIHLSTLTRFEKQYLVMQSVPKQLIEALQESGYSAETINSLQDQYALYRDWQLAVLHSDIPRQNRVENEISMYLKAHDAA